MSALSSSPNRIRLFNGEFDAVTLVSCVQTLFRDLEAGRRGWLATVNVAILIMMRDDARLQRFVDRAAWTVADGQPLVWASRWFNRPLPERVTGVDLVDRLCQEAVQRGWGMYCLGATSDVVRRMMDVLQAKHPGLKMSGADGYFNLSDAGQRADAIRESGAKILLVGMGVPRQEVFIEDQWDRLGVSLAVGVGGSFDVIAGLRHRAPVWMQKTGLEWVFRLIQEPGRLWKRYLTTGARFAVLTLRGWVMPPYRDR